MNEPLAIAWDKWTYEPQDYRAASDYLRSCGVHVPPGTLTDDTIAALVQVASHRTVSTSLSVLLLAVHILQEQLRNMREQASASASAVTENAARIAELEEERAVYIRLADAARTVDAIHKGPQGPQIMRMRKAIEDVDCHNVG